MDAFVNRATPEHAKKLLTAFVDGNQNMLRIWYVETGVGMRGVGLVGRSRSQYAGVLGVWVWQAGAGGRYAGVDLVGRSRSQYEGVIQYGSGRGSNRGVDLVSRSRGRYAGVIGVWV